MFIQRLRANEILIHFQYIKFIITLNLYTQGISLKNLF
jgi:hypothetical protein